jgi:abhydrolase domain-containing protein 14
MTIPLREWQIHALSMGDESAPCVLFLHGAKYTARDWQANGTLAFVARRGWRALAVDVPGFGGTGGAEIRNPYELLPELFLAAGLDRPVVVAPSMGGLYLLTILHQHHARMRGIVPVAPVGVRSLLKPVPAELPALVVWGDGDPSLAQADELVARLPGARKEILAGAGHACYLDRTERFHEILGAFLDELAAVPEGR